MRNAARREAPLLPPDDAADFPPLRVLLPRTKCGTRGRARSITDSGSKKVTATEDDAILVVAFALPICCVVQQESSLEQKRKTRAVIRFDVRPSILPVFAFGFCLAAVFVPINGQF